MSLNWKNIVEKLEIGLIFLCYAIGIGSILFGSLSGTDYKYHFIIIGALALILVIIHTSRRATQYIENTENTENKGNTGTGNTGNTKDTRV